MKQMICSIIFLSGVLSGTAQSSVRRQISEINPSNIALAPFRFLASDELMGRGTKRPEIHVAARYISEHFRSIGLKEVNGTSDYFQSFLLYNRKPPAAASLQAAGNSFDLPKGLLVLKGHDISITAPIIYAKHGMERDLENLDVKGKIVITELGETDSTPILQSFLLLTGKKQAMLQEKGAVAVIERYRGTQWSLIQKNVSNESLMTNDVGFPVLIVNDTTGILKDIKTGINGSLTITGTQITPLPARNVLGWVEGTDRKLKDQFIVLSSHYDHLGVAAKPKMENGKPDSIYNGARDNAIGTTAVMAAARYFVAHPPKRSVLFIAFTAEEMGLLGSRYFAEHPAVPLKQLVYMLNIDNASYNDTNAISLVGLGRTTADEDIKKACAEYGLAVLPDPTKNALFSGSDNFPFAEKGIPAPTFSLGMTSFDSTIRNRYHQLSDEVENFNLTYALKFIHTYILAAKKIADNPVLPGWMKGDKYEAEWNKLFRD